MYLVIKAGKKYTGKNLYHHGYAFGYRNNDTFVRGMIGVMMFRRGADLASTRLLIDRANMARPDASSAYKDGMLFFEDKILPLQIFKEDISFPAVYAVTTKASNSFGRNIENI